MNFFSTCMTANDKDNSSKPSTTAPSPVEAKANEELFDKIINHTTVAIHTYLKKDKSHPGYWTDGSSLLGRAGSYTGNIFLNYDQGFHRASCFKDIIKVNFDKIFRVFVIYTLLNERNGKILKSRISSHLTTELGDNIITTMKAHVLAKYSSQLEKMQKQLLEVVHSQFNEHSNTPYNSRPRKHWLNYVSEIAGPRQDSITLHFFKKIFKKRLFLNIDATTPSEIQTDQNKAGAYPHLRSPKKI